MERGSKSTMGKKGKGEKEGQRKSLFSVAALPLMCVYL